MSIADNISRVRAEIEAACVRAGRTPDSVRLLAVSKFHPKESVEEAVAAGLYAFGENRVQESIQKFPDLLAQDSRIELHLIGSLQRNKVKQIVPYASCIQSVDRFELAEEIIKQRKKLLEAGCATLPAQLKLLFEVHTGEESKSGFTDENELRRTLEICSLASNTGITCSGFMTMAPNTTDESLIRKSFASLRCLSDRLRQEFPEAPLRELSMGMSGDFGIAIEEGSTMVRIGTAIFGQRNYD